ncbi:DMT family transporter [Nakamurella flava]|uniref:DMT family transporter n=1 Tax=Nakamurella flava TaxID=2576308 RepID=A0A4U6QJ04_9ACTN|nr:DMT family transporter [Nakamurella flava]TKV60434.1 DMT family transporter [Nakamurella flava]
MTADHPVSPAARRDLTWLVAVAAALWGTDALLRTSLAERVAASTIVFAEHVVLTVVLLPFVPRASRAFRSLDGRGRAAVLGIGVGASAVATTLFTLAFRFGDPVTPAVIQKFQPLVVLVGAAVLLGERLRPSFLWFAPPALVGAWMLAFPDPFAVGVDRAVVALLALGAAVLWAAGTVLGRFVAPSVTPLELTTLRFVVGLPAAFVLVLATGSPLWVPDLAGTAAVVGVALIPGLLAMWLYYRGLRRTAASRATLAELAYPFTAAVVGVTVLGSELSGTQWIGAALVVASVTALSWHEATATRPAVVAPRPVADRTSR